MFLSLKILTNFLFLNKLINHRIFFFVLAARRLRITIILNNIYFRPGL